MHVSTSMEFLGFNNSLIRKKYCTNCLRRHYGGEDMLAVLARTANWNCPFKMNACCCSKCRNDTSNYKGGQVSPDDYFTVPTPAVKNTAHHHHHTRDHEETKRGLLPAKRSFDATSKSLF